MAKSNIKKNAQGYGYTYTDLAEIHNFLEAQGITYYQYIEPVDGVDYIWTVLVSADGKESAPRRGCRIVEAKLSGKDNPVQAYGASLTYCRRYSLLMAAGLATTDDDAACLTTDTKGDDNSPHHEELAQAVIDLAAEHGVEIKEICERAGVDNVLKMPDAQLTACIAWIKRER